MSIKVTSYHGYSYRWLFAAIISVCFAITYAYTFDAKMALLGDNVNYYNLGKALASGEGYVSITKPVRRPANHHPPGYPVIVSLVLLFSESFVAVKLANGFLLAASLALCFLLVGRLTESYITSFSVCIIMAFNSYLLQYGSWMMSEVPFMFFSLLAIYLLTFEGKKSTAFWIAALITMVAAYHIRSLGIALLGAFVLHFLTKRDWKHLALSVAAMAIGMLPWFLRTQSLGGSGYAKQLKMINPYKPHMGEAGLSDFIARFWDNFTRYLTREIPDVILNTHPDYGLPVEGREWFLGIFILSLISVGLYGLRNYKWIVIGYVLATLAILMLWPAQWIGVRFIVPLTPLLLAGIINAFYGIFTKIRGESGLSPIVSYAPLLGLLFLIKPLNALHEKARLPYTPAWQHYFEAAKWVKKNEKSAMVACGKPLLFHVYSDNYVTRYKFTIDTRELIDDLEKQKVDYVVLEPVYISTFRYLLPAVQQYPERFEKVLSREQTNTYLLRFKR